MRIRSAEARATLEEFLRVAESDMAVVPGLWLKDWESYWHGAFEYQDQKDFDHLFLTPYAKARRRSRRARMARSRWRTGSMTSII